ncbi:hypothetical protein XBKB1_2250003 [Xenorhabdus bovienii str. kraussei Becker Underwood]|uniref:Uncharacterized protein n=1 Tax=Xenorhabdus bovienii str. kraussei Becker Underwood TaxID=1398204 RepID=A0A077PVR9_XENBV|nr:hypothetical protein XBKB1_2250003 [Xenorhabdus bovienii str. kraussei Becker Underwood]
MLSLFKGGSWLKLTFIVVIVTHQNMSKGMENEMVTIPVIAVMPAVRSFSWNTPIKPANSVLKSRLSIWQ